MRVCVIHAKMFRESWRLTIQESVRYATILTTEFHRRHTYLYRRSTAMNSTDNLEQIASLERASQNLFISFGLTIFIIGTFGNLADIILFIRFESLKTLASSMFLLASFVGSQHLRLITTYHSRFRRVRFSWLFTIPV